MQAPEPDPDHEGANRSSALDRPATAEDVRAGWRLALGRELQDDAVVARNLASRPTLATLLERLLVSVGAARARIRAFGEAFWMADWEMGPVDVECTPGQLDRLLALTGDAWTRLGKVSAHHSVLTNPIFAPAELTPERIEHFYRTGRQDVQAIARICRRNGLPQRVARILDFGCGVGRIGEHLADEAESYTGADISGSHLALARERFAATGRQNAEFLLLQEMLGQRDRQWDRIVCYLVLQHNPPPVMAWLLRQLLDRLAPGGDAILQVPVQRFGYGFDVEAYLAQEGPRGMEMHALPQRHVFRIVAEAGCRVVEAFHDGRTGNRGLSYTFAVVRPDPASEGKPA